MKIIFTYLTVAIPFAAYIDFYNVQPITILIQLFS